MQKIFPYSGIFKPYSDVLKPYSGVFLQNFFISSRFREPYNDIFNPYSDVLKPYSGVFLQFMEIEYLKLDFYVDFFPHLIVFRPLKQLIKPRKLAKLLLSPIKQV